MSDDLRKRILTDVKVELSDEFDQNFKRKAFFNQPWQKRMRDYRRGELMAVTQRLRRSFRGSTGRSSIQFRSDAPYASLHNNGGKIKITPRMRAYFWAMYYKHAGAVTKTKGGKVSNSQRNAMLSGEAQFYKNMALTKQDAFVIPQRRIIGDHPKVRAIVDSVANRAVKEYAEKTLLPILKK